MGAPKYDVEVSRAAADGLCRADIARRLGVRESTIGRVCKRLGLTLADGRAQRPRATKPAEITAEMAHALFEYRDGRLIRKVPRAGAKPGDVAGCALPDGYRAVHINGKRIMEHRVVWLLHYGVLPEFLDHRNCIRSDNRIENLRPASVNENGRNQGRVWGAVGLKGVSRSKNGKYQAQITKDGKHRWLGQYDDPTDAARAYDAEAVLLFGEFAKTNAQLGLI